MRVYLATDHAGFELKEKIKKFLVEKGYDVEDCGDFVFDKDDDYPDFISIAAERVSENPQDKAIIFGGSGQAEAMVANKYKGIRAALFYGPKPSVGSVDATGRQSTDEYEMIRLTREHNDANILSIGARFVTDTEAKMAIEKWLTEPFLADARHVRRISKITKLEESQITNLKK